MKDAHDKPNFIDMVDEYTYIHLELADKQNKASWVYDVLSNDEEQTLLGQIKYYFNWRQYAFYPEQGTIYEKTCLIDIADACKRLNVRQKAGIKPQRTLT